MSGHRHRPQGDPRRSSGPPLLRTSPQKDPRPAATLRSTPQPRPLPPPILRSRDSRMEWRPRHARGPPGHPPGHPSKSGPFPLPCSTPRRLIHYRWWRSRLVRTTPSRPRKNQSARSTCQNGTNSPFCLRGNICLGEPMRLGSGIGYSTTNEPGGDHSQIYVRLSGCRGSGSGPAVDASAEAESAQGSHH